MLENYVAIWTGQYGIIAQVMQLVWHTVAIPLLSFTVYTAVTGQLQINKSIKTDLKLAQNYTNHLIRTHSNESILVMSHVTVRLCCKMGVCYTAVRRVFRLVE